jgi:hypothetical protein
MTDDDELGAAIEARSKLAAWSRDTGIPKHGDLTQMDRRIAAMGAAAYLRQLAAWRRDHTPDSGERER